MLKAANLNLPMRLKMDKFGCNLHFVRTISMANCKDCGKELNFVDKATDNLCIPCDVKSNILYSVRTSGTYLLEYVSIGKYVCLLCRRPSKILKLLTLKIRSTTA